MSVFGLSYLVYVLPDALNLELKNEDGSEMLKLMAFFANTHECVEVCIMIQNPKNHEFSILVAACAWGSLNR